MSLHKFFRKKAIQGSKIQVCWRGFSFYQWVRLRWFKRGLLNKSLFDISLHLFLHGKRYVVRPFYSICLCVRSSFGIFAPISQRGG